MEIEEEENRQKLEKEKERLLQEQLLKEEQERF